VSIRALVIDDDPELRAVLGQALRLAGDYEIVGDTGEGQAAIALARALQPDVAILDLGLPDLAGQEVLTGLRAVAPAALIVVYSGSHTPERASIVESVDGFVDKTQDVAYLVDLVGSLATRTGRSATLRIGPDARDVAHARRFTADRCMEWSRPAIAEDAMIVVSELVANALVHVRSSCALTLALRGNVLRVEVLDHGSGMPDLQEATSEAEHGRGLLLVSLLCTAWGTEPSGDGKCVWAELTAEPSGQSDAARGRGAGGGDSCFVTGAGILVELIAR
jgi:DNA-binding response OmpR family regulator